jgi:hypothetical protein
VGKTLLALLALSVVWVFGVANASAAIELEEGEAADTAKTPHFEWEFGGENGNVEWVKSVKWRSSALGTFGSNLATSGGGACGDPTEFWGESYPNQDGTGPAPVVAGQRGNWNAVSNRTALIESSSPCAGSNPEIPVRTRYTFFDEGAAANTVRMERRISFAANQEPNSVVQGMRFYVPRLPAGTYNQEIYPNAAGTGLNTIGDGGPEAHKDWNQTWVAINSSATGAGLLIFHKPDGSHEASITSDNDSASGSNNSGVTLDRPAPGWLEPVTETEYFCFYDKTTWPENERGPNELPQECATPVVPINQAAPKISAGAGNPRAGETFTAEAGSWEEASGGFAYQWYRCSGNVCSPIGGATGSAYTATEADVGHPLRVKVTATATGGETDFAFSNLAGTVSGHIFEDKAESGHELGGARVQICRLKGSPCRSTTANSAGFYRLQAPSLGYYRVTAFPPAGSNAIGRTRTAVTKVQAETETANQDVVLPLPKPPPSRVHFSGSGLRAANAEGVPVVFWQEPFEISLEAPFEKEVEALVEFPDGLIKRLLPCLKEHKPGAPETGIFKFCFQPLYPNHGAGRVVILGSAPRSAGEKKKAEEEIEAEEQQEEEQEDEEENEPEEPEEENETEEEHKEREKEEQQEEQEEKEGEEAEKEGERESGGTEEIVFPIYIDPSGLVRTVDGTPIAGATVTLLEAASKGGPFTPTADGSAVMSPMNRKNPDATDASGHFGWDVVAGFYKVRAEKSGCHAAGSAAQFVETGVMEIPPPVENLDLRLDCSAPPTPPPGPSPRPPPRPQARLLLPRSAKVKVDRAGRFKVKSAKAVCPAGASSPCGLTVKVKAKVLLGSARSSIAAGKTVSLSGKLSKTGLKQLQRAKQVKAKLVLSVSVPGGDGVSSQLAVTLLAPAKKHSR